MAEFGKLQKMLDKALRQAGEESSMLLGQTLSIADCDSVNTNKKTYFADMEDAIFVAGVESREEYPGFFYMIFSLRDAILLSGMLLGIPPARISEKRKLAIMEVDDGDAFGEIMNQIIGSFNSVFKPSLELKVHLKLLTPKKFIPGMDKLTDEEPITEDEYALFRAQLNMDGVEMDKLDILVPHSLANLFDPPAEVPEEVCEDPVAPAEETSSQQNDAVPSSLLEQTVLFLEDNVEDREHVKGYLNAAGLKVVDAPLGADIRELFSQGNAKLALIGVADTEDRELALCIKINAMRQDTPLPIIMCAREWTRMGVLKALKYGAKDILLKPYNADELLAKVNKFLKAA